MGTRYMIASDLHGSRTACARLCERFAREGAERLVLLGDLYYHGPRNPLPEGYAPAETARLLNALSGRLLAVRGNCDAEVDEAISEFDFRSQIVFETGGRRVLCAHGHREPALAGIGLYLSGHTHVAGIARGGLLRANPGSLSLPKGGTAPGYLILDGETLTLKRLDGATLDAERLA